MAESTSFAISDTFNVIPSVTPSPDPPGIIPVAERIIEAIILALICLVAIVGNFLLWMVVVQSRQLRKTSNALVLCLSGADLLVSTVNMPMTIAAIISGRWIFTDGLCVALGFINMNTFIASVMSLGAISINRYVLIVHPQRYPTLFTKRNTSLVIAGVWVLSALLSSPPLFGWAEYSYLPGQSFCFCNWKTSVSYTFFMVVVCFGGPCGMMTFSYLRILMEVRRSRRRVDPDGEMTGSGQGGVAIPTVAASLGKPSNFRNQERQKRRREEEIKLTQSFVVVIIMFVMSWMPFCVTMFWSVYSSTPVPRPIDMTTLLLGYFNSCCNPIIYGVMNKRFRHGYMIILKCLKRTPVEDLQTTISVATTAT